MTGFSGISIILYRLLNIPIGLSTILLNIPVAILCYRLLGRKFFVSSLRCMIISSFIIDYVAPLFPVYGGSRLLAALCTGIFGGLGYAVVYIRNSSTGGSDFIIMAIKAVNPHLFLENVAFLSDVGIILAGGILFRDIDGIIYGMIVNYIFAIVVDKVMYGVNAGKMALIVTNCAEQICRKIDAVCQRGTTIIGVRADIRERKSRLLCVLAATRKCIRFRKSQKKWMHKLF